MPPTSYLGADTPRGGGSAAVFPANQFGGFEHTLFLGCSVLGFTATAGLDNQVSELTVQLVRDTYSVPPGGNPKVYYDSHLNRQTTNGPDPGLFIYNGIVGLAPPIGAPVYFRVEEFEFAGLLSSWTQENSESANPVFTVKITDPRLILENAQLIINDYAGGLPSNLFNVFNVYGFMEFANGSACGALDIGGVSFGTLSNKYGGADTNQNGMPLSKIMTATSILTSSFPIIAYADLNGDRFSPWGRLVYKGSPSNAGYGVVFQDAVSAVGDALAYYTLDLSNVLVPPDYIRELGTNISIMELIQRVTDDAGFDFMVDLVMVPVGGNPLKVIKIRTVDRGLQPNLGAIDDFVGECDASSTTLATSRTKGRELRNETTGAFIIGGNHRSIYQSATENINHMWGLNPNGTPVIPVPGGDGILLGVFNISDFKIQLESVTPAANTINVTEYELMFALQGYESWLGYASTTTTQSIALLDGITKGIWNQAHLISKYPAINVLSPRDLHNTSTGVFIDKANKKFRDLNKIYSFIHNIATEFYGKTWAVNIPFTCYFTDTEAATYGSEAKLQFTDLPVAGGWAWANTVLGLSHPDATFRFTLQDNTLGPFVVFTGVAGSGLSYNNLTDQDESLIVGDLLYVKSDIEPELVFDANLNPYAVLKLPQAVQVNNLLSNIPGSGFAEPFRGGSVLANQIAGASAAGKAAAATGHPGNISLNFGAAFESAIPTQAAVPLQSTVRVYGPWATQGFTLPAGTVKIERDEGLVPWEYGNGLLMNVAGQNKANQGLVNMQVGEQGQITVLGYPKIPLGEEIGAGGLIPQVFADRGFPVISQFSSTQLPLINYLSAAQSIPAGLNLGIGQYGPNITQINVNVDANNISTTYVLRTYTPKYGRFERFNYERFKNIGQSILRQRKSIALKAQKFVLSPAFKLLKEDKRLSRTRKNASIMAETNSAHEMMIGALINHPTSGDFRRAIVSAISTKELPFEFGHAPKSAMNSWDMLFRPVSVSGLDDLPRYASFILGPTSGSPAGAQPPFKWDDTSAPQDVIYNLEIDNIYENPLGNPTGVSSGTVVSRSDTNTGHDIDVIARSGGGKDTQIMPLQGIINSATSDYKPDYKMIAMRGPMLLTSWGYDLDGKPIPNKADDPTKAISGVYTTGALSDKFMDHWLYKSHTWPVGPVDLRFDRERGVWTSPPTHRLITVKVVENISAGETGEAILIDPMVLYGTGGESINISGEENLANPRIDLVDKLKIGFTSGDKLFAYYHPKLGEYWPLSSVGSSKAQKTNFCHNLSGLIPINTGVVPDTQADFPYSRIIVGTGLSAKSPTGDNQDELDKVYSGARLDDLNLSLMLDVWNFHGSGFEVTPPITGDSAETGALWRVGSLAVTSGFHLTLIDSSGHNLTHTDFSDPAITGESGCLYVFDCSGDTKQPCWDIHVATGLTCDGCELILERGRLAFDCCGWMLPSWSVVTGFPTGDL